MGGRWGGEMGEEMGGEGGREREREERREFPHESWRVPRMSLVRMNRGAFPWGGQFTLLQHSEDIEMLMTIPPP